MRERLAFLLIVLSLRVYMCAQEGTVEHGSTDKNTAEVYAAYMLQHAYYEQGYWETQRRGNLVQPKYCQSAMAWSVDTS